MFLHVDLVLYMEEVLPRLIIGDFRSRVLTNSAMKGSSRYPSAAAERLASFASTSVCWMMDISCSASSMSITLMLRLLKVDRRPVGLAIFTVIYMYISEGKEI